MFLDTNALYAHVYLDTPIYDIPLPFGQNFFSVTTHINIHPLNSFNKQDSQAYLPKQPSQKGGVATRKDKEATVSVSKFK